MKYLPYEELDVGAGQETNGNAYPHPGVFYNPRTTLTYVVYLAGGTRCVTSVVGRMDAIDLPEAQPTPSGISEDFVLRALAIAQTPALATTLLPTRAA